MTAASKGKKLILIAIIVVIVLAMISFMVYPLLSQEDDTIDVLVGIIKLNASKSEIVEYSKTAGQIKYIAKTKDSNDPIINLMEAKGFTYIEQFGSGYQFIKNGQEVIILSKNFSRYFRLFKNIPLEE